MVKEGHVTSRTQECAAWGVAEGFCECLERLDILFCRLADTLLRAVVDGESILRCVRHHLAREAYLTSAAVRGQVAATRFHVCFAAVGGLLDGVLQDAGLSGRLVAW